MRIVLLLALSILVGVIGEARADALAPSSTDSSYVAAASDSADVSTQQVPHIVKRDFDARQQVLVGTGIMTFLVVIITTVANWNP